MNTDCGPKPDPVKILVIRIASVLYLGVVVFAVIALRHLVLVPQPHTRFLALAAAYVILASIAYEISQENTKTVWDKPAIFLNSALWSLVWFIILLANIGILGYLLFASWRFMVAVLVFGFAIGCSSIFRTICRALLFGLCYAALQVTKRER